MTSTLNFNLVKNTPLILQTEIAEWGLASMAMIACYCGRDIDLPTIRKKYSADIKGMNLQQLMMLHSVSNPMILQNFWLEDYFVLMKE